VPRAVICAAKSKGCSIATRRAVGSSMSPIFLSDPGLPIAIARGILPRQSRDLQPFPEIQELCGCSNRRLQVARDSRPRISAKKKGQDPQYLPLAVEWGRNMLYSADRARPQSFALATLLSRVCALLEVDPIRDWNIDQPDTWFSIATRTQVALSSRFPKLRTLMENNALIISHDEATIVKADFTGMGSDDFVPLADVPDFFWKPRVAKQGHARPFEGPNHFADMDQEDPHGKTLLDLTTDDAFVDPDKWEAYYDTVDDILSGEPISALHRGLLPFRVWQLFDAMVEFVRDGEADKFVCAAGVLTHYVGDACKPLHIAARCCRWNYAAARCRCRSRRTR